MNSFTTREPAATTKKTLIVLLNKQYLPLQFTRTPSGQCGGKIHGYNHAFLTAFLFSPHHRKIKTISKEKFKELGKERKWIWKKPKSCIDRITPALNLGVGVEYMQLWVSRKPHSYAPVKCESPTKRRWTQHAAFGRASNPSLVSKVIACVGEGPIFLSSFSEEVN